MKPALTAEAVRQRVIAANPYAKVFLLEPAKLKVELGMYTNPLETPPPDATTPYYVFTGGPFDCGPPHLAPVMSPPSGYPTIPPASTNHTCYATIVASAKDGSLGAGVYTSGVPS